MLTVKTPWPLFLLRDAELCSPHAVFSLGGERPSQNLPSLWGREAGSDPKFGGVSPERQRLQGLIRTTGDLLGPLHSPAAPRPGGFIPSVTAVTVASVGGTDSGGTPIGATSLTVRKLSLQQRYVNAESTPGCALFRIRVPWSTNPENSFHPQNEEEKPRKGRTQALDTGHQCSRRCRHSVLDEGPPGCSSADTTVDLFPVPWENVWRCPTCREGTYVTPSVGGESAHEGPRALGAPFRLQGTSWSRAVSVPSSVPSHEDSFGLGSTVFLACTTWSFSPQDPVLPLGPSWKRGRPSSRAKAIAGGNNPRSRES